jgi:hypothetical protein
MRIASSSKHNVTLLVCRCKNAQYLYNGTCVSSCPVGTSAEGTGNFGRRCEGPPPIRDVVCAGKTVVGSNTSCSCNPLADCHTCAAVGAADQLFGTTCQQCKNAAALFNGECVKTCPTGYSMQGTGLHRRTCVLIQTCRGRELVSDGSTCTCNTFQDCHECATVLGTPTQCLACKNGQYLNPLTNACEDGCPTGFNEAGLGSFNLRCDPL